MDVKYSYQGKRFQIWRCKKQKIKEKKKGSKREGMQRVGQGRRRGGGGAEGRAHRIIKSQIPSDGLL